MLKRSRGEKIFAVFNGIILLFVVFVCAYPLYYVICASFSDPSELMSHNGFIAAPLNFNLNAYKTVLQNPEIYTGYFNTIIYVVFGAALSVVMTLLGGYCMSRKNLLWNKAITLIFVFVMYFNGGLIPTYLIMESLGLTDTRLIMIVFGACSTYNMIIMRTTIYGIPDSLEEAAMIDGASPMTILIKVIAPLCKPTLAVIGLFCIFTKWNDWFNPMIFLQSRSKYPLQTFLRELLIVKESQSAGGEQAMRDAAAASLNKYVIQYCTIVVSTVPVLVIYPFLQKYFASGVMVGAVKG